MATNNLLQRLPMVDDIAFTELDESNRRQVETFIASEAIPANSAVCFDMAKSNAAEKVLYVKKATNAPALSCCIGTAVAATASGARVEVVISGIAQFIANGGITAGDSLAVSTVAGSLRTYVASYTQPIVGYAVADVADTNTGYAVIYKRF